MRNVFEQFLTAQRGRLSLFLPVFLGAGILLYFGRTSEPALTGAGALFVVPALAAILLWHVPGWRIMLLCLAAIAAGHLLGRLAALRAPPWDAFPRHASEITGRVAALDILPTGRRVTLQAPSLDGAAPLGRSLRLRLRDNDTVGIGIGDEIRIRCLVQAPSPPDVPGGWDTQRDAFFAGLGGYGFAIGRAAVLESAPHATLAGLRERIAARIIRALPMPQGAIAATLLTGTGTAIPEADRQAFAASGLSHLLAVAGLHAGIVMGLVFFAVRFGLAAWEYAALSWPTRKIASLAALAAGFAYLELTGGHVPIMRSFGMAVLVTLGVLSGRRAVSLRGLALAATILMVAAPESVVGVSFQMSFAAVLCLIAGYELARPLLLRLAEGRVWQRALVYAAGLLLSSAIAGTATLPFAAYHFGRATLYYVPANMVAVPLTAFWVMPWGLGSLALMPFGLEFLALKPMGWGIAALLAIARDVAAWPGASLPIAQFPPWCLALVAAGLALVGLLRGRARLSGLPLLVLGLAAPLATRSPDILVGPDAKLIALRLENGRVAAAGSRLSAYESEAPARLWGVDTDLVDLPCDPAACRITLRGRIVSVNSDHADCGAGVILANAWLHARCPNTVVIDHAFVMREGATTLWLTRPLGIVTDHAVRGDRPWVVRERAVLPMAPTE